MSRVVRCVVMASCVGAGCVPLKADMIARPDASEAPDAASEGPRTNIAPEKNDSESGSLDEPNEGCANACIGQTLGCSETGIPRVCIVKGGCAAWQETTKCSDDRTCCVGACLPVDDSNCFGCGQRCEGKTPTCDKTLRRCACTPAVCASQNRMCDPLTHE